jgi:putative ABC transport system permease protein
MDTIWQDVRYASRTLVRKPGFTAIAVLTLALGIGANTAIFSVIEAVMLRPLPFKDAERIVRVDEKHDQFSYYHFTYASFLDLLDSGRQDDSLQDISAYRQWSFNLTDGGEPEQTEGALVSADFFPALGIQPELGRFFSTEEDQPGHGGVVVIGDALWRRRFGADSAVIGKTIQVNGAGKIVIGVMPHGFDFPTKSALWSPLEAGGSLSTNRRSHLLTVIARLKGSAVATQAQAELSGVAERIERQNPGVDPGIRIEVAGLRERIAGPFRPALLILLSAVGLILLIACANVAGLQISRALERSKETAIRLALGARRQQLIRLLLTESLVLALAGGIGALILAKLALKLIVAISPGEIPRLNEVTLNPTVLAFTFVASAIAGVLFGLVPAVQASKPNVSGTLNEGGRRSSAGSSRWPRNWLVVSEIALALMLLIGAGLLVNSFARVLRVSPGFSTDNLLSAYLFLSPSRYPLESSQSSYMKRILERVASTPGVRSASVVNTLPLTHGIETDFEIAGRPAPINGAEPSANIATVDPGYFRTLEIPLLAGREFSDYDTQAAPRVMIINQTMAKEQWPGEDPIGKRVTMKDWGPPMTGEIIGIVGDVKSGGLDTDTQSTIYWPYAQFPQIFSHIIIRTESSPVEMVPALKAQIWSVDDEQTVAEIRTMDEVLTQSLAQRRFQMVLLTVFAGAGFLLAIVGVYGLISQIVGQRTHEIGIRMALGATRGQIVRLILGQGAGLTVAGVAMGLMGGVAATRIITNLLFGVSATDPATFATQSIALILVALVACYIPARRAARIDPMIALRR